MGEFDDFHAFCNSKAKWLYDTLRDRTGRSPADDFFDHRLAEMATGHARMMASSGEKCSLYRSLPPPATFLTGAEEEVGLYDYQEALRRMIENKFLHDPSFDRIKHCAVFETGVGIRDYPVSGRSKVFAAVYCR